MMIEHTCICGAEIHLSSAQSSDLLRCPDCGMALTLGPQTSNSGNAVPTAAFIPTDHPELFPHADTASIDRSELLALSKSTSKVFSGIRSFRAGVVVLILCAFLFGLEHIFAAYQVKPTIIRIVAFTSLGVAILTAIYALLGWYHWSKVVPPGLHVRRGLLTPLLATSKFGFWILFLVPVAAGFLSAETWIRDSEVAKLSGKTSLGERVVKIDPLALEKSVEQIVDVPSKIQGGMLSRVGIFILMPAIVLPALLTLSIFQIKKFLASWHHEPFSLAYTLSAVGITLVLTFFALVPILGFLISVVAGLYWNRQLTSIGNESLLLLTKLSKAAQEQPESRNENGIETPA